MRLHPDDSRHGSARFANAQEIGHAGYFKRRSNSFFCGFFDRRPMFANGPGGILITAGARSGKLRDVLGYTICTWVFEQSLILVDPKGEMAAIAQNQTRFGKAIYYWNMYGLHGLPSHRIHLTSYLRKGSIFLESDIKTLCRNILPDSGSDNSKYFELSARMVLKAIILTLIERDGTLHLVELYRVVQSIPICNQAWVDFAWLMHSSPYEDVRRVEAEIGPGRSESRNDIKSILSEVSIAVDWMSDEAVRQSVSPPYDVTIEDMLSSAKPFHFVMMPPSEGLDNLVVAMRLINTCFYLTKARNPGGPPITMVIDEAAKFGSAPFIMDAFSIGAGLGIRPVAIYQSTDQLKSTGPQAETIIPASAAVQLYFGLREIESAERLARMIGKEQRHFRDVLREQQARNAADQAMDQLMHGGDPWSASRQIHHQRQIERHTDSMARDLMMANEILGMPDNQLLMFGDGLAYPVLGNRSPYYEKRFMTKSGYHPNPFHGACDKVRVKTFFGHRTLPVRLEPVPSEFAELPQYSDGYWSVVGR